MVGAVADARDAVQALVNGDMLGAALNAAGAIPGPGDAAKVSGVVATFIKVNPGKADELAKVLLKVFKNYAPSVVIFALDIIYKGAATALKGKDVTIDKMGELLDKGVDLVKLNKALDKAMSLPRIGNVGVEDIIHLLLNEKIDIENTLGFIKRSDGSVSWLETGTPNSGWTHIYMKHITGDIPGGTKFPASMSELQIKELIYNSILKATPKKVLDENNKVAFLFEYVDELGIKVRTVVSSNGYIVSSYPI